MEMIKQIMVESAGPIVTKEIWEEAQEQISDACYDHAPGENLYHMGPWSLLYVGCRYEKNNWRNEPEYIHTFNLIKL